MIEKRSYLGVKLGALQRYAMWHYFPFVFSNIRVTEFPKSGGTWLCQLLSEALELPFPRNRPLPLVQCVQHSHYPGPISDRKTIMMVRDGRDVVVSAYYHFIIGHKGEPDFLNKKWREALNVDDAENIVKHLPAFIDIFFSNFKVGGKPVNWSSYLESFDLSDPNLYVVQYEKLLTDGQQEVYQLLTALGYQDINRRTIQDAIDRYSFVNRTGRKQGEESTTSFLRKGIAGDWKNKFSDEAVETFNKWGGEQLQRFGYAGE